MAGEEVQAEPPTPADAREPGRGHWIAQERLDPSAPPFWWLAAVSLIGLLATIVLAAMVGQPATQLPAEVSYQNSDGFLQALQAWVGLSAARFGSAIATGIAVVATAFIARRILHSNWPSIMAAALVAVDPGILVHGRLATPVAAATASALVALALVLGRGVASHWIASALLAYAAFLEPAHLLWALPVVAILLVRGHIYAAPQHAVIAGAQGLLIPGIGALLGMAGSSSLRDGCYQSSRTAGLFLQQSVDLGGVLAAPNLVTWFAGLGALLYLGGGAFVHVLSNFRLQRLPGRLQIRLPGQLKRMQGRVLWLVFIAALAPTPILWVPIFAIGLAAAVQELGRDAKAFGLIVAIVVFVFALAYTIQHGDAIALTGNLSGAPWTVIGGCSP